MKTTTLSDSCLHKGMVRFSLYVLLLQSLCRFNFLVLCCLVFDMFLWCLKDFVRIQQRFQISFFCSNLSSYDLWISVFWYYNGKYDDHLLPLNTGINYHDQWDTSQVRLDHFFPVLKMVIFFLPISLQTCLSIL